MQGVGFRPFVYKLCLSHKLKGWVNNTNDGVHIHINSDEIMAEQVMRELVEKAPQLSVITSTKIEEVVYVEYDNFEIIHSSSKEDAKLLLTPDFAMCDDCKRELYSRENSRFHYPFITCTNCGPRYSIIKSLPYDRETTTMDKFDMCDICKEEYNNPLDRRYYSQTNSCLDCPVDLSLYEKGVIVDNFRDLDYVVSQWNKGKIVAIKGIGGFILTCDATNAEVVSRLRNLKHRPTKPFALMYQSLESLEQDIELREVEKEQFNHYSAPILLLSINEKPKTNLALEQIAPNLDVLGVMLPYTPLYKLLLDKFQKPIIATSGNISNSTIVYENSKAKDELAKMADIILLNNREIVIPQDDSVMRFSKNQKSRVIIRRSRGLAPSYINPELKLPNKAVLSMGAMMKSTFTLMNQQNIYVSQYLGNTDNYEAQINYKFTLDHFEKLFNPRLEAVIADKHQGYFTSALGKEIAEQREIGYYEIQHHKAHFYAVMAENNLLNAKRRVLGVIWDGTGLGDDGNVWGGEFFEYNSGSVNRVGHLDEFPFILGDKMPKEPRISALVMTYNINKGSIVKDKFTKTEWQIYNKLLGNDNLLKSTSIGRFFDAVASIVLSIDKQSFEGEAAMQLENIANRYFKKNRIKLSLSYIENDLLPTNLIKLLLKSILVDLSLNMNHEKIAAKFHVSLAHYIYLIAKKKNIKAVAFSGGVFQNQLLVDLVISIMNEEFDLYFHKELSPNDENISFGQLMWYISEV